MDASVADAILRLPPNALAKIPIGPPPPGLESNFVNPENRGNILVVTSTVFLALGLTACAIRAYCKICVIKRFHWDDLTLLLGLAGVIVSYTANVLGVFTGSAGKHVWDSNARDLLRTDSLVSIWLDVAFVNPALGLLKLSVLLMLYQIFRPFRWLKISVYISAIIICGFYIAVTIALLVISTPRPGVSWQQNALSPTFLSQINVSIPAGAFGLATDIFLVLLPVPAVVSLQMPMKRKLGVSLVFMTGILVCVASAIGNVYRVKLNDTRDYTWWNIPVQAAVQAEMNSGIICVCMPSISKALIHNLPRFKSWSYRLTSILRLRDSSHVEVPESQRPSRKLTTISRDKDRSIVQAGDSNVPVEPIQNTSRSFGGFFVKKAKVEALV